MVDDRTPLRDGLNRSGLPFQLAAEDAIRAVGARSGVQVVRPEVPYSAGFIDILARRENVLFAFECKKVDDDAWIFLLPDDSGKDQTRCRLEWFNPRAPLPQFPLPRHDRVFCSEWPLPARSPESAVCLLPKGKPISSLENVARELLGGAHEILADESIEHSQPFEVMVPVILTNAKLITCSFKPSEVDLLTGSLNPAAGDFAEVSLVRFRKTLASSSSNWYDFDPQRVDRWVEDRERTVFVANPEALDEFFTGFAFFGSSDDRGVPQEFSKPPQEI